MGLLILLYVLSAYLNPGIASSLVEAPEGFGLICEVHSINSL